ncbi:hypothetical protein Bca101_045187 [Brassica carinata]
MGSLAKRKMSGVVERREEKGERVKVGCDAVAAHAEVDGDWRMWGEVVKSGANDERYPGSTELVQTNHVMSRVGLLSLAMPECNFPVARIRTQVAEFTVVNPLPLELEDLMEYKIQKGSIGKRKTEEEQTHTNKLKSQKTNGIACIEVLSKDYFHVYMKELEEILNNGFTKLSSEISGLKAKLNHLDKNFENNEKRSEDHFEYNRVYRFLGRNIERNTIKDK